MKLKNKFSSFLFFILLFNFMASVKCDCKGDVYVRCDSVEDVRRVPDTFRYWWKEIEIGNKYDIPRYSLEVLKFLFFMRRVTIINQIKFSNTNDAIIHSKTFILHGNDLKNITHWLVIGSHMELLSLQDNNIEEMDQILTYPLIHPIIDIKHVDLSHNKLRILEGNFFNKIRVEELILSHNRLSLIRKPHGLPENLRRLHLDYNRFESFASLYLNAYNLSQLQILKVSHNRIHSLDQIPALPALILLDVSFNNIYFVSNILNQLENLRILNLRGNNLIAFNFPMYWLKNPKLYFVVDLAFNRMRNLDLMNVTKTNILFTLAGNPWNCQCLEEIEETLKNSTNRLGCDKELLQSGLIPYCVMNDYYGEGCSEEQITKERLDFFNEETRNLALSSQCVFNIQVYIYEATGIYL